MNVEFLKIELWLANIAKFFRISLYFNNIFSESWRVDISFLSLQVLGNSDRKLSLYFVKEAAPLPNSQHPRGQNSFFCLETPDDNCTTDWDYALQLESKQLGAKRIKFEDKRGDQEYFKKTLWGISIVSLLKKVPSYWKFTLQTITETSTWAWRLYNRTC